MSPPSTYKALASHVAMRRALPGVPERQKIRTAAGVSLRKAARAARVHPETLRRWEAGLCEPRDAHLRAYVDLLTTLAEVAA